MASLMASLRASPLMCLSECLSARLSGRMAGGAWLARDAHLRAFELVDRPAAPDDAPHSDLRGAPRMQVLTTAPPCVARAHHGAGAPLPHR